LRGECKQTPPIGQAGRRSPAGACQERPLLRDSLTENTYVYINPPKDKETRIDPGFYLGGPILPDRLWFFGSYQPGIRDTKRTVTFSNGVTDTFPQDFMVNYGTWNVTGNAGAKRRTLCIRGAPMGSVSEANSRISREIQRASRRLYGTAGAAFIDCLRSTPADALKRRHALLEAKYDGQGVGSTDRSLGSAVASVELASEIAREIVPATEGQRLAAIALAWSSAVSAGEDSDEPKAALLELWGWVCGNEARMYRG